jgi:hypothetical protein
MNDDKKSQNSTPAPEKPKEIVYGPSPVMQLLTLQQELEELLNDKEHYPW